MARICLASNLLSHSADTDALSLPPF
jgi:hypothetical protein